MKKNYYLLVSMLILTYGFAKAQPVQPPNPPAGNSSNCTATGTGGVRLDSCAPTSSTFVSNFQGGTYNRGNNGNNLGVGAIWRFSNIGTFSGNPINAEVTVNAISNAILSNMDDNSGLDQAGVSVANFFAPVIRPDVSLNLTDRRGYVQFTVNFFQGTNNFSTSVSLANLNFVSYDADGSFEAGGATSQAWLRETRVAEFLSTNNPQILASGGSELIGYTYTDPAATSWKGFAGGVYERTGISRCAEVASSFRYTPARSSITFRFGYDFKAGTNGYNIGQPGRQYGARFGCYNFPNQITLPVKLLSFNGAYRNQHTILSWSTENEQNFDHFEIERSSDGINFTVIGTQSASGIANKSDYVLNDDLSSVNGAVFYYRLKIIDKTGQFSYSQVVLIKKDNKTIAGISINPNPVVGGMATVKLTTNLQGTIELRVIDLSGRVFVQQTQKVFAGNNTITVDVHKLQPGIYSMQIIDGTEVMATKFSVIR